MAIDYYRGHKIIYKNSSWYYFGTGEKVSEHNGVKNACCGHGRSTEAYIQFNSGSRVSGQVALDMAKLLKE